MDYQVALTYAAGVTMAAMGWFLRELWEGHKIIRKDMTELTLRLSTNFASKEEIKETKDLISGCERRLEVRLNYTETLILKRLDDLNAVMRESYTSLLSRIDTKVDK